MTTDDDPAVEPRDPHVYLAQSYEGTDQERDLVEASGLDRGVQVKPVALAAIALRTHSVERWVQNRAAAFRRTRRWVLAGITAAAANLALVGGGIVHRLEEGGAAREHQAIVDRLLLEYRDATEQSIRELRIDIRELRAELRRISGIADKQAITIVSSP